MPIGRNFSEWNSNNASKWMGLILSWFLAWKPRCEAQQHSKPTSFLLSDQEFSLDWKPLDCIPSLFPYLVPSSLNLLNYTQFHSFNSFIAPSVRERSYANTDWRTCRMLLMHNFITPFLLILHSHCMYLWTWLVEAMKWMLFPTYIPQFQLQFQAHCISEEIGDWGEVVFESCVFYG